MDKADDNPLEISVKEWKEVLDAVEQGGYKEWRKAVTWILLGCFGTKEEYWNDALFHYKVETAVEMIQRLGKTGGQGNRKLRGQEEETEALETKVWVTADQKVKCSGCDFEISESSTERYTPCLGGLWVPVIT